ncbi:nucleotidyltransferase family protein [Dyella sp. ASV21]|uniref:NTP transferase domain-containing protein n=1 Tax=Dyella sp. ASV21 TaxID=2795114 RepID=UPI0018EC1D7D
MSTIHTRTGAVILAAGNASRFGSLKQVIAIDGEPMVRRAARNALAAGLDPVVVVVGARSHRVIASLHNLGVCAITNDDWPAGMGGSLAIGVKELLLQAEPVQSLMVLLADQPAIEVADLEGLRLTHAASPERILACRHQDRLGPPCVFPIALADELMTLSGPRGAHAVLQKHAAQVDTLDLPAAFFDIDQPDDYVRWLASRAGAPSDR